MLYCVKLKCLVGVQYKLDIQIPLIHAPSLNINFGVTPRIFEGKKIKYHGLFHRLSKYFQVIRK